MSEIKSDAHDMSAPDLLRSAARLIEKSLLKLDMAEASCPSCTARLFHDREHARVYESLANTPEKLRNVAERLDAAIREGARSSVGYGLAHTHNEALVSGPDPRD